MAARLQLMPQQMDVMRFAVDAFPTAVQQEAADVNQLCSRAARLSLALEPLSAAQHGSAAHQHQQPQLQEQPEEQPREQPREQQQQQQQEPAASPGSLDGSSEAAAASKDTPVELLRLLENTTETGHITIQMLNALVFDCLSPLQLGAAIVGERQAVVCTSDFCTCALWMQLCNSYCSLAPVELSCGVPHQLVCGVLLPACVAASFPYSMMPFALASGAAALPDQGAAGPQPRCLSACLLQQDAERHMMQRREQLRQRLQECRHGSPSTSSVGHEHG